MSAAIFSSVRGVIIQRDDFLATFLRDEAGVVLEAELDVVAELKVGLCATETPDDLAGCTVDLVYGAGVAGGNKVVTLGVLVNRVDVEVVPGVRRVVAGAGLAGVDGKDGLCSN
jgi:hypothetical protein